MKQAGAEESILTIIKGKWQIALLILAQAVIFLVIFQGDLYGSALREDFTLDFYYSSLITHSIWPYRDFAVEYPPLALLFITLPRLIASHLSSYIMVYAGQLLVFDLIAMYFIASLCQILKINQWKTLGIYTLALLAIGPIIVFRFDLIPAVTTLAAVYTLIRGHHKLAWGLLAVGALIKIYPLILAPIFLIYQLSRNQRREAVMGMTTFVITGIVLLLPAVILSPGGLWDSIAYHAQRGLQIESTYASILELLYAVGIIDLDFRFSSGSINLVSPLADIIGGFSFVVTTIGLLTIYWLFFKKVRKASGTDDHAIATGNDAALLINYFAITILVFILTSKVFSPQYIIWILPFIPLITGKWRNVCCLLFIMVGLMTFFIYPKYYAGIEHSELITLGMLVVRNIVLIIMTILIIKFNFRLLNS